jgi:predicted transcriptional regulator
MKQKSKNIPSETATAPEHLRISFRLDQPLAARFEKIVQASRRSKTSIIEESLEEVLPRLERRFSTEKTKAA